MSTELLRRLPALHSLLRHPLVAEGCAHWPQSLVHFALRHSLAECRAALVAGERPAQDAASLIAAAQRLMQRLGTGRRAINATGILLHTGLGRAPLSQAVQEAIAAASGYTPVQAGLDQGERITREHRIEALLQQLSGCEAATVVNNNAAATMLMLAAVAGGRGEVVISRGQLVEIGGSFRMPEVMALSGCQMREVGTTNRTHLSDYAAALGSESAAIIRVHTSNYRIRGFASSPSIAELVQLGAQHQLPVLDDLGSGALWNMPEFAGDEEPSLRESIASGVDACCFSVDKLIGGPQAGVICGKRQWIEAMRRHPMARMLRVCKLTLAGVEAALAHFVAEDYPQEVPLYRMWSRSLEDLEASAAELMAGLSPLGLSCRSVSAAAYVGSGSLPDRPLPSLAVAVTHPHIPAAQLGRALRHALPPVFARVERDELLFDLRTLDPAELAEVVQQLRQVLDEAVAAGPAGNDGMRPAAG